jgi:hypothetical protein
VADKLNAAFADLNPDPNSPAHLQLPRVPAADGFDNALTLQGWRGHGSGTLTLEGAPETLAKIGFPPTPRPDSSTPSSYCKVVSGPQVSNLQFRGYSGPAAKSFGGTHWVEVNIAKDAFRPIFWRAQGVDEDAHDFGVLRVLAANQRR